VNVKTIAARAVNTILVAGFVAGCAHAAVQPGPDAPPTTSRHVTITEDDPRWNCLTMGNRTCGPRYHMVDDVPNPVGWRQAIVGDMREADPYRCLIDISDTTTIVCQDGKVWHS